MHIYSLFIPTILSAFSILVFIIIYYFFHTRRYKRCVLEIAALKLALYNHQVMLLSATIEIKEKEQDRIYSNFHDQLNPLLRLVLRKLEMHNIKLGKLMFCSENVNEEIDMILETLENIKSCIYDDEFECLLNGGFIKNLEGAIQKLSSTSAKISFSNLLLITPDSKFSRSAQLNIFRIIHEIINNLLKHSYCKAIQINLLNSPYAFTIEIIHDGKGVSNRQIEKFSTESSGKGLRSCKARCLILNADINYLFSPISPMITIAIPFMK